jgi:hypothetical protein
MRLKNHIIFYSIRKTNYLFCEKVIIVVHIMKYLLEKHLNE